MGKYWNQPKHPRKYKFHSTIVNPNLKPKKLKRGPKPKKLISAEPYIVIPQRDKLGRYFGVKKAKITPATLRKLQKRTGKTRGNIVIHPPSFRQMVGKE